MQIKVQGSKLIIEVDVSEQVLKNAPLSSTGKSRVVDTSHGYTGVSGLPIKLSLNVITTK
jgi:hypothetical protein